MWSLLLLRHLYLSDTIYDMLLVRNGYQSDTWPMMRLNYICAQIAKTVLDLIVKTIERTCESLKKEIESSL